MQTARPTFERLETRTLMAADPAVLTNYLENSFRLDDPGFGNTRGDAMRVELSPMLQTRITGDLTAGDVDMFRVSLTKGQYLNTKLDLGDTRLTVYDARAKLVAKLVRSDALWQVPASGTYYLRLSDTLQNGTRRPYNLDLRPIGLNTGKADPELLQSDAKGVFAVRDGSSLHITGPTGHGFSLIGDWKPKSIVSGDEVQTTYSAAGSVKLRSIVGDIPIPIPSPASIRITTEASQWGRYFGEIESIDLGLEFGPMDFALPFGRSWGMVFNNDFAGVNRSGGGFGIQLGSDTLLKDTGLPLNPAVPYLFYSDSKGFTGSFGGVNLSAKNSFGYAVVVDPSDSFFIGAKGVPVVGDVAFGVSYQGLIPFSPNAKPSAYSDDLFGNVFIKGGLDISAIHPAIPISVEGDNVIDLDANNDGKFLGGLKTNISQMLAKGLTPESLGSAVGRVFGDINIGVNGKASVGWEKGALQLSVPVGEGTFIYSGTRQGMFARGRSADPFGGTPLEIFKPRTSIDIDAYGYRNGTFRLQADGAYNPGLFTMNGSLVVDNNGARAVGTMRALGTNVRVTGNVMPDGRFSLSGKANVNLGPLSGNANFSLVNNNRAVSFGAALSARAAINVLNTDIGGRVDARFAFNVNGSGLTYAGSGSAALFAGPISVGAIIGISSRNLALGLDLGVLGKPTVNIPLPA